MIFPFLSFFVKTKNHKNAISAASLWFFIWLIIISFFSWIIHNQRFWRWHWQNANWVVIASFKFSQYFFYQRDDYVLLVSIREYLFGCCFSLRLVNYWKD